MFGVTAPPLVLISAVNVFWLQVAPHVHYKSIQADINGVDREPLNQGVTVSINDGKFSNSMLNLMII